jgi:hypothetical protein
LFARPGQVLRTTTAFGLAALAVFGLSFGAAVQTGHEKIWELPPARWYARWRHVLWLAVLVGSLYLTATTTLWRHSPTGTPAATLSAVLFFWWSQRMLLGGRIARSALVPGAVVSALGLQNGHGQQDGADRATGRDPVDQRLRRQRLQQPAGGPGQRAQQTERDGPPMRTDVPVQRLERLAGAQGLGTRRLRGGCGVHRIPSYGSYVVGRAPRQRLNGRVRRPW